MKICISLAAIGLAFVLTSCSNGINDLRGNDEIISSDPVATESIAQYQYLGIMYDSIEGKKLNDDALQGEIFDIYRDKVQKALSVYMHFPFAEKAAPSDTAQAVTNGLFSGSQTANRYETPWYESLPESLRNQTAADNSISIAGRIARFLNSPDGNSAINQFLDNIQNRANQMVDNGTKEMENEFHDETNTLAGIFCTSTVVNVFSYIMFIEQVLSAGLLKSRGNSDQVSSKLFQIQQQMTEIQSALRCFERRLDSILGIELQDYFDVQANAQGLITDIYTQLSYLQDDPEGRKELIERYIRTSAEYEKVYRELFEKAPRNVEKYDEVNGIQKTDIPIQLKLVFNQYISSGERKGWVLGQWHFKIKNASL